MFSVVSRILIRASQLTVERAVEVDVKDSIRPLGMAIGEGDDVPCIGSVVDVAGLGAMCLGVDEMVVDDVV